MRKLAFIGLLCAAVASPAKAIGWQKNWLLGVSLGFYDRHANFLLQMNPVPIGGQTVVNRDFSNQDYLAGIFGGYQGRCGHWLAGVEVSLDWEHQDKEVGFAFTGASALGWGGGMRFKRDPTLGVSARVGYVLSYFMPYFRLGLENSRDELVVTASEATSQSISLSGSHSNTRWMVGFGGEMPVPDLPGLTFRLEYDLHQRHLVDTGGTLANGTVVFSQWKPFTHSFKASIVWNFL